MAYRIERHTKEEKITYISPHKLIKTANRELGAEFVGQIASFWV